MFGLGKNLRSRCRESKGLKFEFKRLKIKDGKSRCGEGKKFEFEFKGM